MCPIKKWRLINCFIFALLISCSHKALSAVEFEKGEPSQIRELILKQKQEKEKLVREKYEKKQEEKEKKLTPQKLKVPQQQTPSLTKLKGFLIIGLLLLTIVGIAAGFIINYKRMKKE